MLERLSRRLLERHGLLVAPMRYSALDSSRQPPSLKCVLGGRGRPGGEGRGKGAGGRDRSDRGGMSDTCPHTIRPLHRVMVTANHDEAQLKSLVAAIKESLRALR